MSITTFTELLRHPNEVVARTDDGAVRITRRDASDLVLVRAGDYEAQFEGVALASQIMRAAIRHDGDIADALDELFAWTALLSPKGKAEFGAEIERLIWSATELGTYGELLNAYRSWRGTAEALADGIGELPPEEWINADEREALPHP